MTKLAKKINKENQPYRAIFNYLSKTEVLLNMNHLSNLPDQPICTYFEFYDFIIEACENLKAKPRGLKGEQCEDQDPNIFPPSNN